MGDFQWEPLPLTGRPIRLLLLFRGLHSDPVVCRLDQTDINHCGSYEALSYEWGPIPERPEDDPVIVVNGLNKRIRQNLFHALRYIRCEDRDRYLWVDALCINQNDESPVAKMEKKRSILMMGDIYRGASLVVVWQGLATKSSDAAIASIQWIHENFPSSETTKLGFGLAGRNLGYASSSGHELISDDAVKAIELLCQSSYWTRVWMIQELNLAQALEIHCGASRTSGTAFESALAYFYHNGKSEHHIYHSIISSIPFAFHFNYRQPGYKHDPRKTTFATWISSAIDEGFKCYKPQDLAYALIGQSYGLQKDDLIPDYDKPMTDVFVDTLVAWALSNLELEYGSYKFVTEAEASKLADRLLANATGSDSGSDSAWVNKNAELFTELYTRAMNQWRSVRERGWQFIDDPVVKARFQDEEDGFRENARRQARAALGLKTKR